MIGAEDGDSGLHARGQFHPATVHWRQPDGTVGWLRVEHHGPTRARAERAPPRGRVRRPPAPRAQPVRWVTNTHADRGATPTAGRSPASTVDVEPPTPRSTTRPPLHLRPLDAEPPPSTSDFDPATRSTQSLVRSRRARR